jgi:hypothetical protein
VNGVSLASTKAIMSIRSSRLPRPERLGSSRVAIGQKELLRLLLRAKQSPCF